MNLFDRICLYENLVNAFDKVEDNGGAPGVDRVTIEEFSVGLERKLLSIREELKTDTYTGCPRMCNRMSL